MAHTKAPKANTIFVANFHTDADLPRRRIFNGPSKYALSVALFHGHSEEQIPVIFEVGMSESGPHQKMKVRITRLEREDGSGEKWIFQGYLIGSHLSKVSGYFSIQTRTGFMEIES